MTFFFFFFFFFTPCDLGVTWCDPQVGARVWMVQTMTNQPLVVEEEFTTNTIYGQVSQGQVRSGQVR